MYVQESVSMYDYDEKARSTTTGKRGEAEARGEKRRRSPKQRRGRRERSRDLGGRE